MTPLNTIIEEEKKEFDSKFVHRGVFGERRLNMFFVNNHTRETPIPLDDQVVGELESFLTTAMQRAYEAGVEAERERIQKRIVNAVAFFDRDTEKARGARYGLEFLLSSFTPLPDNK